MCSGDVSPAHICDRRSTLPSIAIRRPPFFPSAFPQSAASCAIAAANGSGASSLNSRENVSRLGAPRASVMKRRRNASLLAAKSAMSTQVCPPHMLESSATITISRKSWRFALPVLGSSASLKQRENICPLPASWLCPVRLSPPHPENFLKQRTLMYNRPAARQAPACHGGGDRGLGLRLRRSSLVRSLPTRDIDPCIFALCEKVKARRPRAVISHIIEHGAVTTEELQSIYRYDHPRGLFGMFVSMASR